MVSATDIAREQDAGLKRLYERGLELAEKMQEDAMAAATADERARLGAAFHRISRGVRQTAALRVKLAGDATRCDRDEAAEVVRLDERRRARRKDQVSATVQRLIWTEAESDDSREDLKADLEDLLDIEALDETFATQDLDLQVARICETLGLPDPPLRGRWPEGPEGVEAHSPLSRPASQPPQSLRDSSPSGGAANGADHPWRSSA
ncbi:MAG: hypothetical protein JWP86_2483 [Phenylobacterium sp.]|nr:hypothetical protein [Phenylobacterium sp.]